MGRRAFVAGIWHETNTFSAVPTDLTAFRQYQYAEGASLLETSDGTNTEVGGMLAAAPAAGIDPVPGLFAGAVPSGLVTAEAFAAIRARTAELLGQAGPVDGLLAALHGAFVADGAEDGDAAYLSALRQALPRDCPVVGTLDLHANLSAALVRQADLLIGYKTYPHRDMGACGEAAVRGLAHILDTGRHPAWAFAKLPFMPPPQVQVTDDTPAADIMALVGEAERRPDVWSVSVTWGFPYADIADLGVGVLAYADDRTQAAAVVREIAAEIWRRRDDFDAGLVPVRAALDAAAEASGGPTIVVEVADNAGGGTPGDATPVLQALLERRFAESAIVIWDPSAVERALAVGDGGVFRGDVGGRSDDRHGSPVALDGRVVFLGDVSYRRTGNYMTGQQVRLGPVAVVRDRGVSVMLTSEKAMPFDNDHLRAAGIVPERQRLIVVKSAIAWRPHFRPFAVAEHYVDTPGIAASNLARFDFTRGGQNLYPVNPDARWQGDIQEKPS